MRKKEETLHDRESIQGNLPQAEVLLERFRNFKRGVKLLDRIGQGVTASGSEIFLWNVLPLPELSDPLFFFLLIVEGHLFVR